MYPFKHQCVRDLAWALGSPPLVSGEAGGCVWPEQRWFAHILAQARPWLQSVDAQPAELQQLLQVQKDRRLGRYFETLWFYWLQQHPRYQVLARNLQLVIDGETRGEIDFIVYDLAQKKSLHLELAVKFYLGEGDTRSMSNWYGPNRHDRMDLKVAHLRERQSVISHDPGVRQHLQQLGLQVDECRVILKGRLYYPWRFGGVPGGQPIAPSGSAQGHLYGGWLTLEQFDKAFEAGDKFDLLIDRGWLSETPLSDVGKLYSKTEVISLVSAGKCRVPLHLKVHKPQQSAVFVFLTDM